MLSSSPVQHLRGVPGAVLSLQLLCASLPGLGDGLRDWQHGPVRGPAERAPASRRPRH